jgi:hypothetical protein
VSQLARVLLLASPLAVAGTQASQRRPICTLTWWMSFRWRLRLSPCSCLGPTAASLGLAWRASLLASADPCRSWGPSWSPPLYGPIRPRQTSRCGTVRRLFAAPLSSSTAASRSIPAVMVTHAAGKRIRAAIDSATSHLHPAQIVLGRSPHFRSRSERREDAPSAAIGQEVRLRQAEDLHVQSDSRGASDFVPLTLPVRFEWAAHPEAYLPKTGSRPPSQVLHGSGGEASRPPSTRTASSASQGPSEVARLSSGAAEDSPARGAVRLVRTTPHAMADELAVPPGGLSFTL